MSNTPEQARTTVGNFLMASIVMLVIGSIIAGATWPHSDLDSYTGDVVEHGNTLAWALGLVVAGVGQTLLFFALGAHAVRLGIEMTGRNTVPAFVTPVTPTSGTGSAGTVSSPRTPPTGTGRRTLSDIEPLPDRSHMDEDGK